jgi:hypothetical protein
MPLLLANKNERMIRLSIASILLLCTCFAHTQTISAPPVILHCSESVRPGEPLGIQGHAFGTAPQVGFAIVTGKEKNLQPQQMLPVAGLSDTYLTVTLPGNVPMGLYAVWVNNGVGQSKPFFVNRARALTYEFDEIMPGTVFRLFGRNLWLQNSSTRVRFVHPAGKNVAEAQVLEGDAYTVKLKAPAQLEPGISYQLYVSNGNGGSYGETLFEETIRVRAAQADPFSLGVPWGADFDFASKVCNVQTDPRLSVRAKGDGIANDRQAIQEAIDQAAAAGGGVVYLPAGTYKLVYDKGCGITMRSRVVIKGDGKDKTLLTYGYGTPFSTERVKASYGWTLGWPDSRTEGMAMVFPGGITTSGLTALSMINKNESGAFLHTIKDMPEGGSRIMLQNCGFDVNTGWGLALVNIDKLLVSGCTITSSTLSVRNINAPTRTWPWDLKNSYNVIFRNNQHFYTAGRFGANGCHHAVFENNHFTRDGDHQAQGETGGLSLDYTTDLVVLANTFEVTGNAIPSRNQGETILSQGGNAHQQTVGKVTMATATTLTDQKQEWQDFTDRVSTDWQSAIHPTNYSIVIVAGTGAGQWRTILGNNDTTLRVDRPWDVIPATDSRYVITQWSAYQMLVKDNVLKDNNRGIWFYSGGADVAITGNKLINSEGIYIRADQRLENKRYNLSWNMTVSDNVVENTNGKRAAYITWFLAQVKNSKLHGTGIMGAETRHNTVRAFIPNTTTSFVKTEGYLNYVQDSEVNAASRDTTTAGILGAIFDGNKAINTDNAYQIGSGAHVTSITNAITENVQNFLKDTPNPQTKTGAKATVLGR